MIRTILRVGGMAMVLALGASAVQAATIYTIEDIQDFDTYTAPNVGQSYAGTGFVGLYDVVAGSPNSFVHLYGLEVTDYSRTALQVDIGGLAGQVVSSAILQFDLLDGTGGPQDVTATSFTADGTLEWFWDAPDNLGQVTESVSAGAGTKQMDVTSLLAPRVFGGATWFGLHLQGSTSYQYTYTGIADPDAASVRLIVETRQQGVVPEPSSLLLLGGGLVALRRRRKR